MNGWHFKFKKKLTISASTVVLADLRGAAQSRAQRLRCGLDHRHQSASGDPHLFAPSCAAMEGKTTHDCIFFYVSKALFVCFVTGVGNPGK